jgi:dCTP deaminase
VDLTLGGTLLEWTPKKPAGGGDVPHIVPNAPNFDVQGMMEDSTYSRRILIDPAHGYVLKPQQFILGFTREVVRFPHQSRIAARVEEKSSLARLGLGVHVTAPTIHAGFGVEHDKPDQLRAETPIQLEIHNLGPWPIKLEEGMRICQLILEEVREVPSSGYLGQFNRQRGFTVPPEGTP